MRAVLEVMEASQVPETTPACLHSHAATSTKEVVRNVAAPGRVAAATRIITVTSLTTMTQLRMPGTQRRGTMTAKWLTTATCSGEIIGRSSSNCLSNE